MVSPKEKKLIKILDCLKITKPQRKEKIEKGGNYTFIYVNFRIYGSSYVNQHTVVKARRHKTNN